MRILQTTLFGMFAIVAGCQSGGLQTAEVVNSASSPAATAAAPAGSVSEQTATLYVKGMSCPLCANNIDKQLMRVPGVQRVTVDLGSGEVQARLAPGSRPTRDQLAQAIAQSGFTLDRIEMPTQ